MPPSSKAHPTDSYLEMQRWIERSIPRCQCSATTRFLEMVRAWIDARLRDIDNAGEV